jgi:hypothetical protein
MEMAGHVAGSMYRIWVGNLEGKRSLGRPKHRWEDNIKMGLREICLKGVD